MKDESPYDILGVDPSATHDQIKKAYRDLSKGNHPDKMGSDSMQAKINWAWEIIGNEERRKRYDITGRSSIDQFNSKMGGLMSRILPEIIFGCPDPTVVNIIESCKAYMVQIIDNNKNSIERSKIDIDRLDKVLSRMSSKGNRMIINFINDNVKGVNNDIKAREEDILFFKEVLEVLDDYEYRTDEIPNWQQAVQNSQFFFQIDPVDEA